jgi:hypothetical protein
LTPLNPSNLILTGADWSYLVAILIFTLISWVANALKKRQEEAAKKPRPPAQQDEDEEVEPAEVLGPDEPPFRPFPPVAAPPIRRYAERPQFAGRGAPPVATPAARPISSAPQPPRETRVKQPRQRVVLAESPTLRASDLEAPVVLPIARVGGENKPLARVDDMLDAFGHPTHAAVQERLRTISSAESSAPTPASATLALLRQLRATGSPLPRQAILLSEVLAPPLALRRQTPGLPPLNDV